MTVTRNPSRSPTLYYDDTVLRYEALRCYNHCDLTTLGAMVSDDLEFYHDQTGLSVGKGPFLAAIKQNICGKVERALLPDTLEVPAEGIWSGRNRVHASTPWTPEDGAGDAKFVTLCRTRTAHGR